MFLLGLVELFDDLGEVYVVVCCDDEVLCSDFVWLWGLFPEVGDAFCVAVFVAVECGLFVVGCSVFGVGF